MLQVSNYKYQAYFKAITVLMAVIFCFESTGYCAVDGIYKNTLRTPLIDSKRLVSAREAIEGRLNALDHLYSFKTPAQRARVRYIAQVTGIIDPGTEIAKVCAQIGKDSLKALGLDPDEYIIIVSDSDEINAGFYTTENERVVEINMGLLQFMKRNNILDKDTITFILGHETGHSVMADKRQKGENRHGILSEEYRSDSYGLEAEDKTGCTPLAGLKFIEALRKEQKSAYLTITHPQTHRRQIKIFNEIRYNYWHNLSAETGKIDDKLLDIEKSGRRSFDERLYSNISLANIVKSIEHASSHHDLIKLMHILYFALVFKASLEELKASLAQGINLAEEDKEIRGCVKSFKPERPAELITKYLNDEKIDPREYISADRLQLIERIASEEGVAFTEALIYDYLSGKIHMKAWQLLRGPDEYNFGRFPGIYSQFKPIKEYHGPKDVFILWERMKQVYSESCSDADAKLRKKAEGLIPELAGLTEHDKQAVLDLFFLAGVRYVHEDTLYEETYEATASRNKEPIDIFKDIQFDNPIKVLTIISKYSHKYHNEYLKYEYSSESGQHWAKWFYSDEEKLTTEQGEHSYSLSSYTARLTEKIMDSVKQNAGEVDKKDLLELYQILLENKNILMPARFLAKYKDDSLALLNKVTSLLFSKITTFSELKELLPKLKGYITDEFNHYPFLEEAGYSFNLDTALFYRIIRHLNKDEVMPFMEFLVSNDALRYQFYYRLTDICNRGIELGINAQDMIKALDAMLSKYDQEKHWKSGKYETESHYPMLCFAYSYLISKVSDNALKKELFASYYAKYKHVLEPNWHHRNNAVDISISLRDYRDSLVSDLCRALESDGLTKIQQLEYLIENGFLFNHGYVREVWDVQDRERLFNLLKSERIKERFINNRVSQEDYKQYVSFLAWAWFFNDMCKPQWRPSMPLSDMETQVGVQAMPLHRFKQFLLLLEPCNFNTKMFKDFLKTLNVRQLDSVELGVLFDILKLCIDDSELPKLENDRRGYDDFIQSGIGSYVRQKDTYLPFYFRAIEKSSRDSIDWVIAMGQDALDRWLGLNAKDLKDPNWPLQEKIDIILQCFPNVSEYRNKLLVELIGGNPFKADIDSLNIIFEHLKEGYIKNIAGRRIILDSRDRGKLNLKNYTDVQVLMDRYFKEDCPEKRELFNLLLQDVEVTIDELEKHSEKDLFDEIAMSRKKAITHEVLERLADNLESKPVSAKRELFEWLIGLRKDKPDVIKYYEYVFKVNLDDVNLALANMTKSERYGFLGVIFIGGIEEEGGMTPGILNDEAQKKELLKVIFESITGKRISDLPIAFAVVEEIFSACPELKQLDLLNGLFDYCIQHGSPSPANQNDIILRCLMAFGLVGVKAGQTLATTSLLEDDGMKEKLKDCFDEAEALDKRFLLNAMLFDHPIEVIKAIIKSIGRLLGRASIKQGYVITKKDGVQRAEKFIKPLAHYEVDENFKILRTALSNIKAKNLLPRLNAISDRLYRKVEAAVRKEFDLKEEADNQTRIGGLIRGEKGYGWKVYVPVIDSELRGKQFIADELCNAVPLDEAEKYLKGHEGHKEYRCIMKLISSIILKQVFLFGDYHADLHPGNIMVDLNTKTIYIIDFGNCASLSKDNRKIFLKLLASITLKRLGMGARIEKLIRQMSEDPNTDSLSEETKRDLDVLLKGRHTVYETLNNIKNILDKHDFKFNEEFELLFKFFETVRYIFTESKLTAVDFMRIALKPSVLGKKEVMPERLTRPGAQAEASL